MLKKIKQWINSKVSKEVSEIEMKINAIKKKPNLHLYDKKYINVTVDSIEDDIMIYKEVLRDINLALEVKSPYQCKVIIAESIRHLSIARWYSNHLIMLSGNDVLYTWLDLALNFHNLYSKIDISSSGSYLKLQPYYYNVKHIIDILYELE